MADIARPVVVTWKRAYYDEYDKHDVKGKRRRKSFSIVVL
jgi:hypothetical protein